MTTGTVCLHTLILLYIFRLSYAILDYGPWSSCSKSCDIGTRTRTSNSGLIEEEFCNLHFCPRSCDYSFDCGGSISVKCENHTCICNKGDDFDKITCKPSVGSCIIRDDPPSAIGFRDPTAKYPKYGYNLESCTTNDNSNYEVHIIEIYGDRLKNIYEIFVVPRGPVNKPIILFLKSYESTKWKIDTSVGIYKVFYTGYHIDSSSVVKLSSSRCDVPIFTSHYDYEVVKLMRQISKDFGPVTSYTYYYKLDTESPKIILQVGGSPLQVFQRTYMYNVSQSCSNGNVACPEYYSETNNFAMQREWTQWTECSKSCNIGTQNRCRFVPGKDTIDNEERYCNTQFCPIRKACAFNYECMARGTCYGGQCQCKLGDGYNIYTCLPEIYNCSIRENSIMALGYKDSTTSKSYSSYSLHSCTTVGNNKNEVHVIGIYGDRKQNTYTINVISRGPVTKPIILVLSSYEVTHWKINSTVDVAEVLYRGSMSSVEKACNHSFDFKVTNKDDLPFDYGSDAVELLKYVGKVYGSVTSFTGYYHIKSENPAIILNVGGDPMKVLPRNYIYKPDGINVEAPTNANEMQTTDVLFTVSGNLETDPSADGAISDTKKNLTYLLLLMRVLIALSL